MKWYIPLLAVSIGIGACQSDEVPEEDTIGIGLNPCKGQPGFIAGTGLNPATAAFSTSERDLAGVALIEVAGNAGTNNRRWQHPSWNRYGTMGPLATDPEGNVYVAPVPVINLLHHSAAQLQTIYRIDAATGEMKPFLTLPVLDSISTENPYGLIGLFYDCYSNRLFASSLLGSGRNEERGHMYSIDPAAAKVTSTLSGVDAIGLASSGAGGQYRLYYGRARNSEVYSVKLDKNGNFKDDIRREFSLDMLGPRGDDKARRIRVDANGDLLVSGVEFNYNLTAPTEKQEMLYRFHYNDGADTAWQYVAP